MVKIGSYDELKKRAERCCCKQCGGKLEIRLITYDQYGGAGEELFCPNCQRIEYGTEVEIYQAAEEMVDQMGFNYFPELEENERSRRLNIAKVCEILAWFCKKKNLINDQGVVKQYFD